MVKMAVSVSFDEETINKLLHLQREVDYKFSELVVLMIKEYFTSGKTPPKKIEPVINLAEK